MRKVEFIVFLSIEVFQCCEIILINIIVYFITVIVNVNVVIITIYISKLTWIIIILIFLIVSFFDELILFVIILLILWMRIRTILLQLFMLRWCSSKLWMSFLLCTKWFRYVHGDCLWDMAMLGLRYQCSSYMHSLIVRLWWWWWLISLIIIFNEILYFYGLGWSLDNWLTIIIRIVRHKLYWLHSHSSSWHLQLALELTLLLLKK